MVMYNEKVDFLSDFAMRTKANLHHILAQDNKNDVYEVTQLINSLLGLVVFAKEHEARSDFRLHDIELKVGNDNETTTIIEHVRHALSHYHIRPIEDQGRVCGFKMWNGDGDINPKNWSRDFTVEELHEIAEEMCNQLTNGIQ